MSTVAGRPRVSVIVPVHDRRVLLRALLDALAAQTFRDFEVIVVDDGSEDGSAEEVAADARAGRPVRVIRTPRVGAVSARRAGVSNANADFLAFTDSDCVPSPGWLAAGVAALESGADVANGPTRPAGPVGVLDRSVGSGEEGLYPTCNVFYRRSAYDAAGGFDPRAGERLAFRLGPRARGLGFGEDTLLAWRVRRAGRACFAPEALVEHQVIRSDIVEALSRAWMAGAFPALVRETPELRGTDLLRHGVSLGTRSRLPVYATGLALASRRRAVVAVAVAAWVRSAWRELEHVPGSRRARIAGLPIVMAKDVVVSAALVAGSARARTAVL
jgi:glycosyltransferase involved in cell wall biosynthesis